MKIVVRVNVCPHGWAGCRENYTGGHLCDRDGDHKGQCRCVCGARTNVKPENRRATRAL